MSKKKIKSVVKNLKLKWEGEELEPILNLSKLAWFVAKEAMAIIKYESILSLLTSLNHPIQESDFQNDDGCRRLILAFSRKLKVELIE